MGGGAGAVVFVPRVEDEVMEPSVMRTMSCGWMWITPVLLASSMWISSTVLVSESVLA